VRSFDARKTTAQRYAGLGYGVVVVLLLAIGGCVTGPPVQEMSDARQAIAVAKDAGAAEFATAELSAAVAYLESAQEKLSERHYKAARQDAKLAKDSALDALTRAEGEAKNDPQ
jgi:hypothetical protein